MKKDRDASIRPLCVVPSVDPNVMIKADLASSAAWTSRCVYGVHDGPWAPAAN